MGFILNLVNLALQKLHLLLLLLNLIKSGTTQFILPILSFFIISLADKAPATDTIDLGSITGLVKPNLEKSLYSYPASRVDISNKMGSAKLSPTVVDKWANNSFFSKNEQFFSLSVDNLVNKNAITSNFQNVSDGV